MKRARAIVMLAGAAVTIAMAACSVFGADADGQSPPTNGSADGSVDGGPAATEKETGAIDGAGDERVLPEGGVLVGPAGRYVFVTRRELGIPALQDAFVDSAVQACRDEAIAATLPGSYQPWVTIRGLSPAVPILSGKGANTWHLPSGALIATTPDLTAGGVRIAINQFANGEPVTPPSPVWTGTTSDGGAGASCEDWKDTGAQAIVGNNQAAGVGWTNSNPVYGCTNLARVYCFQVGQ